LCDDIPSVSETALAVTCVADEAAVTAAQVAVPHAMVTKELVAVLITATPQVVVNTAPKVPPAAVVTVAALSVGTVAPLVVVTEYSLADVTLALLAVVTSAPFVGLLATMAFEGCSVIQYGIDSSSKTGRKRIEKVCGKRWAIYTENSLGLH
jgi:hypothetical protein